MNLSKTAFLYLIHITPEEEMAFLKPVLNCKFYLFDIGRLSEILTASVLKLSFAKLETENPKAPSSGENT